MVNRISTARTRKSSRKVGRPSQSEQGREVLILFRTSPIELQDHPLAHLPKVKEEAKLKFGQHPFREALMIKVGVREGLLGSAAALDGVPSQRRLKAFLLALAEGLGPGAASDRAQTSREHGSRKFMKLAAAYVWRALEERFR